MTIGLELVRDHTGKEPAAQEAKAIRAALRERRVLVGVGDVFGNMVRIQLPLSITPEECEQVAAALEEILARK